MGSDDAFESECYMYILTTYYIGTPRTTRGVKTAGRPAARSACQAGGRGNTRDGMECLKLNRNTRAPNRIPSFYV